MKQKQSNLSYKLDIAMNPTCGWWSFYYFYDNLSLAAF